MSISSCCASRSHGCEQWWVVLQSWSPSWRRISRQRRPQEPQREPQRSVDPFISSPCSLNVLIRRCTSECSPNLAVFACNHPPTSSSRSLTNPCKNSLYSEMKSASEVLYRSKRFGQSVLSSARQEAGEGGSTGALGTWRTYDLIEGPSTSSLSRFLRGSPPLSGSRTPNVSAVQSIPLSCCAL